MSMPRFPSNGLTLASLFAGCGGSSLGYRMAGYDVRLAVERDAAAAATYHRNFRRTPIHEGDICGLNGAEALRMSGLKPGALDVLDGSPPCQGFSSAGKRRMADKRNRLFEEYVRLLGAFRPRAFVMENVGGLVRGKMRLTFAEMTLALKAAGYRVSCRLLNAWWYGVPQDRRRLIWVGFRDDLSIEPSHPPPLRRTPVILSEALPWVRSMRYDPRGNVNGRYYEPSREPSPTLLSGASVSGLQSYHFSVSVPPGLDPHSTAELAEARLPAHYAVSRALAAVKPGASSRKYFNLKRAHPDRPAQTLLSRAGETLSMAAVCHPFEARRFTIREAKVLMSFPESFTLEGSYGERWALLCDAVPPLMAEAVGRHVASLLGQKTKRRK